MKGKKYLTPKVECYSCGDKVVYNPYEMVRYEDGKYFYYFCEKCSDKNEHIKLAKKLQKV